MKNLGLISATKKQKKAGNKKCSYHHKYYLSYYKEEDQRYCKEGCDLYRGKYAECKFTIQDIEGPKAIVLSLSNPVYLCPGQNKFKFRHALCSKCYKKISW